MVRGEDPFMRLLEGSLAAPDLDLERGVREQLLAEAGKVPPPKVVELVTEEAWDVAAFDWILGEYSTDAALMDRLADDSVFATSVAEQLGFVRKLRLAMRPNLPVAAVPQRRKERPVALIRLITAGLAAVIAWMLVLTIPSGLSSGSRRSAAKSGSIEKPLEQRVVKGLRESREVAPKERRVEGFAETPTRSRRVEEGGGWRDLDSVRKGADLLEFSEATQLAARELFSEGDPGFATASIPADPGMEVLMASSSGRHGSILTGEQGADWMFTRQLLANGQGLDTDLIGTTIPEPSGLFLIAVGWLALMARRRRA